MIFMWVRGNGRGGMGDKGLSQQVNGEIPEKVLVYSFLEPMGLQ